MVGGPALELLVVSTWLQVSCASRFPGVLRGGALDGVFRCKDVLKCFIEQLEEILGC